MQPQLRNVPKRLWHPSPQPQRRLPSQRTLYGISAVAVVLVYGILAPSMMHRGAQDAVGGRGNHKVVISKTPAGPHGASMAAKPLTQEQLPDPGYLYEYTGMRDLEQIAGSPEVASRNQRSAWVWRLLRRLRRQNQNGAIPLSPPPPPPQKTKEQLSEEARLRWWWPDGTPRQRLPNETAYGDPAYRGNRATPGEQSYYLHWIRKDLQPWADAGGITQEDVRNASALYRGYCEGDVLRFQILQGRLWVDFRTRRSKKGWYPAKLGPGNTSAKGRIPYVIFALLDVLRAFPGEIPDVDAVVHTADFPCVKKSPNTIDYKRTFELERERPTPMLGYNGAAGYWDIPIPDYSFYGHEHSWLLDAASHLVVGWPQQADFLRARYSDVPLWQRKAAATWRGRTEDPEFPDRDALRRRLVACPEKLQAADRPEDAALFDFDTPNVTLANTCDFRFSLYVESKAYASNLRQKLACGSPLLAPQLNYYEWWSRALLPGTHFVQVSDGEDMCADIVAKVRELNEAVAQEQAAAQQAVDSTTADTAATVGNLTSTSSAAAAGGIGAGTQQRRRAMLAQQQTTAGSEAPCRSHISSSSASLGATDSADKATISDPERSGAGSSRSELEQRLLRRRLWQQQMQKHATGRKESRGVLRQLQERDSWHVDLPDADEGSHNEAAAIITEKDAARQFSGELKPWGTALGGKDEVSPDEWRRQHTWGSRMSPSEIGEAAQQFLADHLRMEDVRLYLRDLLREYAALQRFRPFRSEEARCMNWDRMLREFGLPRRRPNHDEDLMATYYPYLRGNDIYSCSDEHKVPYFWYCEAIQNWQPRKRKKRQAERCNLPWGPEAQKEWERNPVGKGYV